jgi:predicted enzyme related to lactoylglutathione lyase
MKTKVGVLLIGVSHLNKSKNFYEQVFGIETIELRPPFMQGKLGNIEFNIEENDEHRHANWAEKNIGGRKSFTFQVEDIYTFLENVKEAGGTVLEEPIKREWGWYDAVIADLDGNEFVIEQEIDFDVE